MPQVRLILSEDVPNLGDAGDLVSVKPGFARNYLLPQGRAIPATETNVRELEHHKRVVAEKVARERKGFEDLRAQLQACTVEITMKAGEEGRLFGSVTVAHIADFLAGKGFELDRRRISLAEPIKQVGDHKVRVRLHRDVDAEVTVRVTGEASAEQEVAPEPAES